MFEINSSMKSSFISRIHASGFTFSGKKISLLSDVR